MNLNDADRSFHEEYLKYYEQIVDSPYLCDRWLIEIYPAQLGWSKLFWRHRHKIDKWAT
ncbi:hypothetical protein GNE08_26315 [Trichormus variabilis ARAD]|uniref:Uncharacterized protein n=1 Tax=Trichormus variabilis N2B TaxID=2681315 RepID=A0ABR6S8G2_ANAVA|nr:hypothetical protein [Trichormus variabilis]MBC1217713.1 hypothetical protein [Trichormus variabilis ARAD]MBC1258996.1 hypothetical protein [Trichormus variabilis V5]MBC1302707.1 hypothetical protein [Trichormus variabilis N2B]MBC1324562.1 hypothetical protein [Trichormus variabilis 9RC]MBC1324620.1 hypothetical protein [Trichormus variabilis 9RC]